MKHIYILSTCDDWKSRGSMVRYYVGSSDKAGTRRLMAAITKGIRDHIFRWSTNGEQSSGTGTDRRLPERREVCGCYSCA